MLTNALRIGIAALTIACCVQVSTAQQIMRPVLPQGFMHNNGQWPKHVIAGARTASFDVYLTTTSMIFDRAVQGSPGEREAMELRWATPGRAAFAQRSGMAHKFANIHGSQRSSTYLSDHVYVRNLYEGIDLDCMISNGKFRFDLFAKPGADVSKVTFSVHGTMENIATDGSVVHIGDMKIGSLAVLQDGMRVPANFDLGIGNNGERDVMIRVRSYDRTKPLVIDPIVYGTFMGGVAGDRVVSVRVRADGSVVVVGNTNQMSFPPTVGRYKSSPLGGLDAYVAVMDSKLENVVAYTYLGGGDEDQVRACHVDGEGNVYLAGSTKSNNFPTSIGAAGQVYKAQYDAWIAKLDPTLTTLLIGSYLGGNKDDWANAVVSDVNGNVIVVGGTTSNTNFPTNNGYQKTAGGLTDAFIARLSSNGGAYQFSSFFGKSGNEQFTAVTVDPTGSPYVTGSTTSSNFETAPTPGRFSSNRVPYDRSYNGGNTDAFVIKFYNDGSLSSRDDGTYSTFFGGNGDEEGRSIFVDALGRAYVVGVTTSTNLEALGTYNTTNNGGKDVFLAVFAADGRDLQGNTYFGKSGDEEPLVAIDGNGSTAIIGGVTVSNEFPNAGIGTSNERKGPTDAFLTLMNTATNIYTDVIGGAGADSIVAMAIDANGDIYLAMNGTSMDLPVVDASYDKTPGDAGIGYVAKYAFGLLDLSAPRGGETYCLGQNVSLSWSVTDMPATEKFIVELSSDDGATWSEVVRDLTARSYTWRPSGLAAQGGYRIRVRTERGHVSVCPAPFSISAPPSITQQPAAVAKCLGQPATLSVQAAGSGLRYQWRRNGTNIQGATNATYDLTISPGALGRYDCVISGSCNPNVTSAVAEVSQAAPTAITAQPTSVTLDQGAKLTLKVTATGSDLAYQWEKDGSAIPGATSATYEVAAAAPTDAGQYRCAVTGGCGMVTSETATVTVNVINSVEDDPHALDLRILGPQPASEALHVQVPPSAMPLVANVRDLQGRLVLHLELTPASIVRIDVSTLPVGAYGLELRSADRVGHATFVVDR